MKKSPAAIVTTLNCLWQSAALTLLAVYVSANVLYWLIPAASPELTETYKLIFIARVRYAVLPEAKEQGSYVLCTLLLPLLAYLAVRIRKVPANLLNFLACLWLALTVWLMFGNVEFVNTAFRKVGESPALLIKIDLCAAAMGVLLWFWRRPRLSRRWLLALSLTVGLLLTAASTLYVPERITEYFNFHFDPILQAVSQTAGGMHFVHQYGFYPEFLRPVFHFVPATIRNINVVFSLMTYFSFAMVLLAAWRMIRNPLVFLFLSGALAVFCTMGWGQINGNGFDPYFPYYPIRTVFPTLFLALAAVYCHRPFRHFYLVAGVLAGAGVFWNFDVGVVAFGAFVFLFGVEMWFEPRQKWRPLVIYLLTFAVAVPVIWGYFCCLNQKILTPAILFQMQRSCAVAGYFMLPMPALPFFWGMLLAVYVSGIVWGIYTLSRHDCDPGARWVMFASVIGLGVFSYYAGRSHVLNMPHVIYPALLILGVYLDRAIRLCRFESLRLSALALAFPGLFVAAAAWYCMLSTLPSLSAAFQKNVGGAVWEKPGVLHADAEYIRNCANGRKANIFGTFQGFLYAQSRTRGDVVNSNEVETILQSECERVVRQTAESGSPLFLASPAPWGIRFDDDFLQRYYELKGVSATGRIHYYEPRRK